MKSRKLFSGKTLVTGLMSLFVGWLGHGAVETTQNSRAIVTVEHRAIHAAYDTLLQKYVAGTRFRYAALAATPADKQRLRDYLDRLESQNPEQWRRNDALAFWLNLYNAATLELVIAHYPVKSIKDIGGLLSSPWNQVVVMVAGKKLTLNDIENKILRPQFQDARIHFAINCASIGCPPLASHAYLPDHLDAQLDAACTAALNDNRWVGIADGKIYVTKIFDWYEADFVACAGSVRDFIARYRPADRTALLDKNNALLFNEYNWNLNSAGF